VIYFVEIARSNELEIETIVLHLVLCNKMPDKNIPSLNKKLWDADVDAIWKI
jgi:hypothetical protein